MGLSFHSVFDFKNPRNSRRPSFGSAGDAPLRPALDHAGGHRGGSAEAQGRPGVGHRYRRARLPSPRLLGRRGSGAARHRGLRSRRRIQPSAPDHPPPNLYRPALVVISETKFGPPNIKGEPSLRLRNILNSFLNVPVNFKSHSLVCNHIFFLTLCKEQNHHAYNLFSRIVNNSFPLYSYRWQGAYRESCSLYLPCRYGPPLSLPSRHTISLRAND